MENKNLKTNKSKQVRPFMPAITRSRSLRSGESSPSGAPGPGSLDPSSDTVTYVGMDPLPVSSTSSTSAQRENSRAPEGAGAATGSGPSSPGHPSSFPRPVPQPEHQEPPSSSSDLCSPRHDPLGQPPHSAVLQAAGSTRRESSPRPPSGTPPTSIQSSRSTSVGTFASPPSRPLHTSVTQPLHTEGTQVRTAATGPQRWTCAICANTYAQKGMLVKHLNDRHDSRVPAAVLRTMVGQGYSNCQLCNVLCARKGRPHDCTAAEGPNATTAPSPASPFGAASPDPVTPSPRRGPAASSAGRRASPSREPREPILSQTPSEPSSVAIPGGAERFHSLLADITAGAHQFSVVAAAGPGWNEDHQTFHTYPLSALFLTLGYWPNVPAMLPMEALNVLHRETLPILDAFVEGQTRAAKEKALFWWLGYPKVVLSPLHTSGGKVNFVRARAHQAATFEGFLALLADPPPKRTYRPRGLEHVPGASADSFDDLSEDALKTVARLLAKDKTRQAGAVVSGRAPIAPLCTDTYDKLDRLHPAGPETPFSHAPLSAPPPPTLVGDAVRAHLWALIYRLDKQVSPGVSGWDATLLKHCFKPPKSGTEPDLNGRYFDFALQIGNMMLAGTCPGRDFLLCSTLTPIQKVESAAIRPIAGGEAIFKVISSLILRSFDLSANLAPFQLGVGSPGGVEPIVEAVHQAVDRATIALAADPDTQPLQSWLCLLDLSNAFNNIDRSAISQGVAERIPAFYKLMDWMYGKPSALLLRGQNQLRTFSSTQGVRQGDPMGPLLFSMGIASKLTALGDSDLVKQLLAYLDDVTTLSDTDLRLLLQQLFSPPPGQATTPEGLALNLHKTKSIDLAAMVRENGTVRLLGTCVGHISGRRAFLHEKLQDLRGNLHRLRQLPPPQAYHLLTKVFVVKNIHLCRSMDLSGLDAELAMFDALHEEAVRACCGAPFLTDTARTIIHLPLREGGLGIYSLLDLRSPANLASLRSSRSLLAARGLVSHEDLQALQADYDSYLQDVPLADRPTPELHRYRDDSLPSSGRQFEGQSALLRDLFAPRMPDFHATLPMDDLLRYEDNRGKGGRLWLNLAPGAMGRIPDDVFQAGLCDRLLLAPPELCPHCSGPGGVGHLELCDSLPHQRHRNSRHTLVRNAFQDAFAGSYGVSREPHLPLRPRRPPAPAPPSAGPVASASTLQSSFIRSSDPEAAQLPVPDAEGPRRRADLEIWNRETGDTVVLWDFCVTSLWTKAAQASIFRFTQHFVRTRLPDVQVPQDPAPSLAAVFRLIPRALLREWATGAIQAGMTPAFRAKISSYANVARRVTPAVLTTRGTLHGDLAATLRRTNLGFRKVLLYSHLSIHLLCLRHPAVSR